MQPIYQSAGLMGDNHNRTIAFGPLEEEMKTNYSLRGSVLLLLSAFVFAPVGAFSQPASVRLNQEATRVLGHVKRDIVTASPNYVEGRELTTPQGLTFDTSSTTPILYVADTGNNRVLAWRNPLAAANGAPADLVIGQRDRFQTSRNGPGTTFTTGLNAPTGVAVDAQGNLYVADANNNRILRFPKPFEQGDGDLLSIDIIIGQDTFGSSTTGNNNGRFPNRNRPTPAANAVFFSDFGSNLFRIRMTFDPQGNLYVADAGNARVLRFPARVLTPGNFGPDADLVLGQLDFTSRLQNSNSRVDKSRMGIPAGITFSPTDSRLYVCDNLGRILVYRNPSQIGQSAERILGVVGLQQGQTAPPTINDIGLIDPESVVMVGNTPLVVDTSLNRVVRYDAPDSWPAETAQFSPRMRDVIGQADFNTGDANRNQRGPNAGGFNSPTDAAVLNNNLFVADGNNHRVLVFSGGPTFAANAVRVFGQTGLDLNGPNLVEGREFFFTGVSQGIGFTGGGIALDGNIMYVADTINHRVLGFRDVRSLRLGQFADLVIGQVGPERTLANSPTGNLNIPNQEGLYFPHAVAVDANGDLYVADTFNSRVVRYPRPFAQTGPQRPNLVLGQVNFTSKITDASARNMNTPMGLAFSNGGNLLVSDSTHNRVLFFQRPPNGDFTNGQPASIVFGQPNFITTTPGNDFNRMTRPRGITVDVDDRLYVVDAGNSRVHIYNRAPQAGVDPNPALTLGGFSSPNGIAADLRTGEIWITDGNNNRALRFPAYDQLTVNTQATGSVFSPFPLDVKVDANSNVVVADAANRVAFFYQAQASQNAANQQTIILAPGTIASMYAQGGTFASETAVASTSPLPTVLADTEVQFNDVAVPLYFVAPGQINFLVPMNAPTSGRAEAVVLKKSTGQVLAAGPIQMGTVAPGFFTSTSTGRGQVSALNQDNTVNSPTNAIPRGQVIQLYGTGLGFVQGAPPDGTPTPGDRLYEGEKPDVFLNGLPVPAANVLFSGLAPGFVGVWQLNVRVPDNVPPGNAISILVRLRSVPSQNNLGTTISVRQ
jgi:uncharacterized protein (TIGR03437 family)